MKKLILRAGSALSLISPILAQTYDYTYDVASDTADAGVFGGMLLIYCLCCLVGFAIAGAISYLIYKDAVKHNVDNPTLWAVLVFFTGILGIIIYLLAARNENKS